LNFNVTKTPGLGVPYTPTQTFRLIPGLVLQIRFEATIQRFLYTTTNSLFPHTRSLSPDEHSSAYSRDIQDIGAIRIWTCDLSIGRHPVISMGLSLLLRQKREDCRC